MGHFGFGLKLVVAWIVLSIIWESLSERRSKRKSPSGNTAKSLPTVRNPLEIPDAPTRSYQTSYGSGLAGQRSPYRYMNGNTSDDLVYLLANADLGILKIGIGKIGRVRQYFISSESWKVVGCFRFTDLSKARASERAVLRFWRFECNSPAMQVDLGLAPMISAKGERHVLSIGGETETVNIRGVCEHCTIHLIEKSSGYLGDFDTELVSRTPRRATCRAKTSEDPRIPSALEWVNSAGKSKSNRLKQTLDLGEFIELNMSKLKSNYGECWIWDGPKNQGYAYISWEGKAIRLHRHMFESRNQLQNSQSLLNQCANRACINPDHWEIESYERSEICLSPGCASEVLRRQLCSACFQRWKRRRDYYVDGTSRCLVKSCERPASKVSKHGFCPSCRKVVRAESPNSD